jgi:maleylpyruvate isomerase
MDEGTTLFSEGLEGLEEQDHDRPTLLEDWNLAQLVAHVNSNARALVNLTNWARTGVESPMYESNDKRARDIDEGAKRSLEFLIEAFHASSTEFSEAIRSLSPEQLDFMVLSARGREIPVSEAVWIRIREIWIHAVDLGVGIGFSRFPTSLLDALMEDVTHSFSVRENPPPVELTATDVSNSWKTARSGTTVIVEGRESDLLAWLVGRSRGEGLKFGPGDGEPPVLPPWL